MVWSYRRAVPQLPSPLVYRDVLYMLADGGGVGHVDLADDQDGGSLLGHGSLRAPGEYCPGDARTEIDPSASALEPTTPERRRGFARPERPGGGVSSPPEQTPDGVTGRARGRAARP